MGSQAILLRNNNSNSALQWARRLVQRQFAKELRQVEARAVPVYGGPGQPMRAGRAVGALVGVGAPRHPGGGRAKHRATAVGDDRPVMPRRET